MSSQAQDLAVLSRDIQSWVKQNIKLLKLDDNKLQKLNIHVATNYASQSTCQLVNGHCLLSIIGAVVPDVSLKENTGFFTGRSNSSRSVVNAIQTLADFETSFVSGDLKSVLALTSFTNLFNWPHQRYGRDQEKAGEILIKYLHIMQPLIVTVFGGVLDTFTEYKASTLTESVAVARIIRIMGEQRPAHMISIPQFHPGHDVYAFRPQAYHRLRFLCWISVWTHMDVSLTYLAEDHQPSGQHQESVCVTIMDQAKIRLEQAGYYSTLTALKQQAISYNKTQAKLGRSIDHYAYKQQGRKMPENSMALRTQVAAEKEFLETTLKLGVIYGSGAEGTKKRVEMMRHSWCVHKDYLCEALQISEMDQYQVFYENEPQNYYLRVCIEASRSPELVPRELRTVVDSWYTKTSQTPSYNTGSLCVTERRDVYQTFAQYVVLRQTQFKERRSRRCPTLQISELEDYDVGTKFGPFTIDVISRTGQKRKIATPEFQKHVFKKHTYLDRRVLHIHAHGTDVKDELGQTLSVDEADRNGKVATIQQDDFSKYTDGKQLEWLWQEARRESS